MAYADLNALIESLSAKEEEAKAANLKRQAVIESIFDEVIARYGPEGTYGKAAETLIEKQKVRDVSATAQRDIGRGLYGIRPYEAEWEATTGAEARLKLEDIKMERLSQAQLSKAGFLEGITDEYPDYGSVASLAMQAAASQGTSSGGGGGGGGGGSSSSGQSFTDLEDFIASNEASRAAHAGTTTYGTGLGGTGGGRTGYAITWTGKIFPATPQQIEANPYLLGATAQDLIRAGLGVSAGAAGVGGAVATLGTGITKPGTTSNLKKPTGTTTVKKTSTPVVSYGYSPYGAGGF